MTGRGEGYCAIQIPEPGQQGWGYAGLQGTPVRIESPATAPGRFAPQGVWRLPLRVGWLGRRGRGRRFGR